MIEFGGLILLQVQQEKGVFDTDFGQKILILLIGSIVTFCTTFFFAIHKRRDTPSRRLQYSSRLQPGLVSIDESIKHDVALRYKGSTVDKLVLVSIDVWNSGNTVVKGQELRFEFPGSASIIDTSFDPPLTPELQVDCFNDSPNNPRFRIPHLERRQRVGFRFVVAGNAMEAVPTIHPFNESGDVALVQGHAYDEDVEKADIRIERFILLFALFLFVPPTTAILGSEVSHRFSALVQLIILVAMAPQLAHVAASVALLLRPSRAKSHSEDTIAIDNVSNSGVMVIVGGGPGTQPQAIIDPAEGIPPKPRGGRVAAARRFAVKSWRTRPPELRRKPKASD